MKIMLKNYKWVRYVSAALLLTIMVMLGLLITAEGEEANPRFVLMRLEDIGPGGQYATLEQLGKLRAVFEFLQAQRVPYHLAVIPRWINILPDGTKVDHTLDEQSNSYIQAFDALLKQAETGGASIGMHGYTHQFGSEHRGDGFHESGIGNEFNVAGSEESGTVAFASQRLKEGLHIFEHAGFVPQFWEAPHYHSTAEQDRLFRSFFGLHYQANVNENPNASAAQYVNTRNMASGEPTLGSVYVPTPYSYIPYNKDEKLIIDKLGKSKNIASFFYHPFLEFKYLIPVTDVEGESVLRDGVPEYKYPPQTKTLLQKLITGLKDKHYQFYSIHDYVPFTPANSFELGESKYNQVQQVEDVTGDGQADIVSWNKASGDITVEACNFRELRNIPRVQPIVWATIPYTMGSVFTLGDGNKDGKKDVWIARPNGKLERYDSTGKDFVLKGTWNFPKGTLQDLYVLNGSNHESIIVGQTLDHTALNAVYLNDDVMKMIKPYKFKTSARKNLMVSTEKSGGAQSLLLPKENNTSGLRFEFEKTELRWTAKKVDWGIPDQTGRLLVGDFNGDHKEDVIRWDMAHQTFTVYLQVGDNQYHMLSTFGPWGEKDDQIMVADLDGNGKSDIALWGRQGTVLDTALSFETLK